MLSYKKTSTRLLPASLVILLGASLLGCATQSKNTEVQPAIKIPNLPSSVIYTEPKLPDVAKDANETAKALKAYEEANASNKFAIEQAQKHNKRIQRTYNKKAQKKEEQKNSFSFSNIFKF